MCLDFLQTGLFIYLKCTDLSSVKDHHGPKRFPFQIHSHKY